MTACAHRPDFGSYGQIEDPEVVIQTIRERYARVDGLVGEGKLGLDSPQGSGTLRMAVEVRKPANVYLETADIFGIARGTLATDGRRFSFYRPDENVLYTGPATAEELGRYLPIALPPDRLAAAMLGQIPLLETDQVTITLEESTDTYLLLLRKGSISQRLRVGTRDLRLISIATRGEPAIDASFEDHETLLPGLPFGTTVNLEIPRQRTKVKLRYTKITLNPETSSGDFVLEAPPGARIEGS